MNFYCLSKRYFKRNVLQLYPGWGHEAYFVATNRYSILRSDALAASHPMTHFIETPLAIDAMFNNVAYGKGKRLYFICLI